MLKNIYNFTADNLLIENGESIVVTKIIVQDALFPADYIVYEGDGITTILHLHMTSQNVGSNFEMTTNWLASKGVTLGPGAAISYNHGAP